jgi:hypothetical protein
LKKLLVEAELDKSMLKDLAETSDPEPSLAACPTFGISNQEIHPGEDAGD